MKIKNFTDAIELREILKVHKELLSNDFDEKRLNYILDRLCHETDDNYLNFRAENFKNAVLLDKELKNCLGRLEFENIHQKYILKYFNSWVMPMDTAFRRRWDFEYLGIDKAANDNKAEFEKYKFKINSSEVVNWDLFRRALNKKLSLLNIPEDKLLGPYFISKSVLEETNIDKLTETIKNKVLMYLYEDAAKAYKSSLFAEGKYSTYSTVCKYFDENALTLFKGNLEIETEVINKEVLNT